MSLHIKNGRVIDPANGVDRVADVFVADGVISGLGQMPEGFRAERVIDATGKLVMPGLVDLAARLREPVEYRTSLQSELRAALAGGITTLVLPPDTDPALDEPGLVEMLKDRARQIDRLNLYPLGAMTVGLKGEVITEMAALTEAGCIAFSQADEPVLDTTVILRAMQYARTFDYVLWLRAQDPWLSKGGVAASGAYASRLGLSGIPTQAETIAIQTLLELQRSSGVRLHLCRLSSAAGIELVRAAKKEGLPVTCDVSVNHVHLTDLDIGFYDSNFRLDPPLRSQRDRDAIRAGLADGTIDAVCSDHNPVDDDAKLLPFAEAEPGATGLELLLSLTLKWAMDANVPLLNALAHVTSSPARVLAASSPDLPACGRIGVGDVADLCLVDQNETWVVDRKTLLSQSAHTPFLGLELPARVCTTIVRGRVVWEKTV
ncbi:dihydroorotase [Orrella sp. NBD-18]|uniref:Dihydroorotase n=1 Tax=Sheuella amnicola TaxID=2707330 RepID=A0A6B2RAE2_9BURK|nr:dihydroorotase [Sheuella amnicola]NDY84245.1 dihydroorotase [Sheuella amnicola]